MPEKPTVSQCGACFGTRIGVVEEAIPVDMSAFSRYGELFLAGKSPQICRKGCGTYFVCHLLPAAPKPRQD